MSMSAGKGKAEINMTPMIDVLLVLIIIFMVIAPVVPRGLETLVPQPPPPNQQQRESDLRTVVIVINKGGSIMINQEPVTEAGLGPRLAEIFKTRAERVVFVKGDPDLEYANVARAIDTAHGVGIDKVGLMTEKMAQGQ